MDRITSSAPAMLGGWFEGLLLSRRRVPPPSAADAAAGIRRVELRHARLRVLDAGAGAETVVMAPDPPNTLEHYPELLALLTPRRRVICFEPTGYGLSFPRRGFHFTLDDHAAVLIELMDQLAVRGATLAMGCFGAYVALAAARRRPDLVARLVLNQVPAVDEMVRWTKRFDYFGLLGTAGLGQLGMRLVQRRATRAWYEAALPAGVDPAPWAEPALALQRRGGAYALAAAVQALFRVDPAALCPIEQETVMVWGAADRTHARTDPDSFRRLVPDARVVRFERCGHFPDLEAPAAYAPLVLGA